METPSIPAHRKKYSFSWAWSIVKKLYDKYPRATDIYLEIYDISLKTLAMYLAYGDPFFAHARDRIHFIDLHARRQGNYLTSVQYFTWESGLLRLKGGESMRERLDKRLLEVHAQRAGIEGGASDRSVSEGRKPSFHSSDLPGQLPLFKEYPLENQARGQL